MPGLNKLLLIGNVGSDPEMRYTPSGTAVTSFRMATSRSYTAADGERREETEWFTVTAWNKLAEQVNQIITKGRQVYVEGRLKSRSYQGRDGQTHFVLEVTANQVLALDRKPGGAGAFDEAQAGPADAPEDDDIPF